MDLEENYTKVATAHVTVSVALKGKPNIIGQRSTWQNLQLDLLHFLLTNFVYDL